MSLPKLSPKRAAEIKAGAKMSGTFKIDVAAIRARQGVISPKVADTLFGKAKVSQEPRKALKRTPMKAGRKATGEAKVFREIMALRPHVCEVCHVYLSELGPSNFSHILPKGSYPGLRLEKGNIVMKCRKCHALWHQHGAEGLRYTFGWSWVVAIHDVLKAEYNRRMSAELSGKS